jgi:hypothetical protein
MSSDLDRKTPEYFLTGFGTHWSKNPEDLQVLVRSKANLARLEVIEVLDDTHARIGLTLPILCLQNLGMC